MFNRFPALDAGSSETVNEVIPGTLQLGSPEPASTGRIAVRWIAL